MDAGKDNIRITILERRRSTYELRKKLLSLWMHYKYILHTQIIYYNMFKLCWFFIYKKYKRNTIQKENVKCKIFTIIHMTQCI